MIFSKERFLVLTFGILFLGLILIWVAVFAESKKNKDVFLEVTFFDVGQGDAAFIETPGGRQILIDGGPDATVLRGLGNEMPFYDRDIDIVILTHPDSDHINGIIDVLKRYDVGVVLDTGVPKENSAYQEYRETITAKHIAHFSLGRGSSVALGDDIRFDILHPLPGETFDKINNTSMVARLSFRDDSFLFTGDIERPVELELTRTNRVLLDTDVLKVAHHGSKTSTTELFLEAVRPEIAVISVGANNRYGHPTPTVLEALQKYGIIVVRTDREGDIKIVSRGYGIIRK